MKTGLLALVLVLALAGRGSAATRRAPAPPPMPRRRDAGLPSGLLPGVPPDLQRPPPAAPPPASRPAGHAAPAAAGQPQTPASGRAALAALPPPASTRGPAPTSRGTRLSVQPAELPSTPLAEGMTVEQRARARQLARAAAHAVRGEAPARRAGVQPQPLAPVAAFQSWVGLPADGKWGRETRRYAAAFTGEVVPAEVW